MEIKVESEPDFPTELIEVYVKEFFLTKDATGLDIRLSVEPIQKSIESVQVTYESDNLVETPYRQDYTLGSVQLLHKETGRFTNLAYPVCIHQYMNSNFLSLLLPKHVPWILNDFLEDRFSISFDVPNIINPESQIYSISVVGDHNPTLIYDRLTVTIQDGLIVPVLL